MYYRIPLSWTPNTVFMWKFLVSGSANKSEVRTRAVINFNSGTENQTRLQKSVKNPGQKLVTFDSELRNGHYDIVASFKLPSERWNGMYQSAPGDSNFVISNMGNCKPSPSSSLFLNRPKCTDVILARSAT
jgi:hypothetical protein